MSEAMNEWCGPETAVGLDSVTAFFSVNICKVIIIIHGNPLIREYCTSPSVLKTQFLLLQNVIGLKFLFFQSNPIHTGTLLELRPHSLWFYLILNPKADKQPLPKPAEANWWKEALRQFPWRWRKGRKLPPHPLYTLTRVSLLHTLTRVPLLRITWHDRSSPGQGNDL